jgi:hypothetical protein
MSAARKVSSDGQKLTSDISVVTEEHISDG